MVTFDEIDDVSPPAPSSSSSSPAPAEEEPPSQARLLDAEVIEEVAKKMTRISARMHLESLAKKLRKESEALKRVEKSKSMSQENDRANAVQATTTAAAVGEVAMENTTDEKKTDDSSPSMPPPKKPVPVAAAAAGISPSAKFIPVDRFSFDAGGYNASFVTLYVPLPGVGSIARDLVTCEFTKSSFDLIVRNLKDGKSYRLFKKDDLEHDIDATKSKIIVKADKVIVKLAKVKKGDYGGFDYWTKLTDTKKGANSKAAGASSGKENPQDSIMNLMKNLYDEGDDTMKKMIGTTMMKQQRGELNRPDMKMGGAGGGGGLGDMNFDDDEF